MAHFMHNPCTHHAYRSAAIVLALGLGAGVASAQDLPEAGLEMALTLCTEAMADPGLEAFGAVELRRAKTQDNGAFAVEALLKSDGATPQTREDQAFGLEHFYNPEIEGPPVNTCTLALPIEVADSSAPVVTRVTEWAETLEFERKPGETVVEFERCAAGDLTVITWSLSLGGTLVQMFHIVDEKSCEES